MRKKDKIVVAIAAVSVLIENYLVFCYFEGERGFFDLLLCGIFVHIPVGLVAWAIANNYIRDDVQSKTEEDALDTTSYTTRMKCEEHKTDSSPRQDLPMVSHVPKMASDKHKDPLCDQEPTELGVRQKIKIADSLYSNTCIAVMSSWNKVFELQFPTPKGAPNQLFVLCMQVAVSWLVMLSYDYSHKKGRTAQVMWWLELASRSRLFPELVADMHSSGFDVKASPDADYAEKMAVKYESYSRWIRCVMEKQGLYLDSNQVKEELKKAQQFAQFWYDDDLAQLIKGQRPYEAVIPQDCTPGSMEMNWIINCQAAIAQAKW